MIEAAISVFAENGYAGATTSSIAQEAKASETLIFRHFGSKRGLWRACVEHAWSQVSRACVDRCSREADRRAWPLVIAQALLEHARGNPLSTLCWIRALNDATGDSELDAERVVLRTDVHRFFEETLGLAWGSALPGNRDQVKADAWTIMGLVCLLAGVIEGGDSTSRDHMAQIGDAVAVRCAAITEAIVAVGR